MLQSCRAGKRCGKRVIGHRNLNAAELPGGQTVWKNTVEQKADKVDPRGGGEGGTSRAFRFDVEDCSVSAAGKLDSGGGAVRRAFPSSFRRAAVHDVKVFSVAKAKKLYYFAGLPFTTSKTFPWRR